MLNRSEQKRIQKITELYYMQPVLKKLNCKISEKGYVNTLDFLHEIITSAEPEGRKLQEERKISGKIKNVDQAIRAIVGNIFSNCVLYLLLHSKETGDLRPDIYVTDETGKNPLLEKMTVIHVDGETQKPDMDLVLYTLDGTAIHDCLIVSLKTSLRERAGQTYKWKLLLEIATTKDATIRDKYGIHYDCDKMPKVCFAMVNFYNEINNPQHRGMFKFFDSAFIGKPIDNSFISRLSQLVHFANQQLEAGTLS
jgi:type II restriction enzyme